MSDAAVILKDVVKRFGNFVAVDHISLEIASGEIFGFLGPNGAGKSTTIRMLCGLLRPSSGQGWVHGLDIVSQSEQIKSKPRLHVPAILPLRRPAGRREHGLFRGHLRAGLIGL